MEWWQITLLLLVSIVAGVLIGTSIIYVILRHVQKHDIDFLSVLTLQFARKLEASRAARMQPRPAVPPASEEQRLYTEPPSAAEEPPIPAEPMVSDKETAPYPPAEEPPAPAMHPVFREEPAPAPLPPADERPVPAMPPVFREEPTPESPPPAKELPSVITPELAAEIGQNRGIASQPLGENLPIMETRVWDEHQHEFESMPAYLRDELEQVYIDIRLANRLAWFATEFGRRTPELEDNYLTMCARITERLDRIG